MKRRVVLIIVFLLLGAIVNVAVAWGCAFMALDINSKRYDFYHDFSGGLWITARQEKRGVYRVTSHWTPNVDYIQIFGGKDPDSAIPPWASFMKPTLEQIRTESRRCVIDGRGWPMLSLWSRIEYNDAHEPSATETSIRHGLPIEWDSKPVAILPMRPIWPGILVNTLLYALLVLMIHLMVVAPFAIRRALRRKRRLCEKCAYPIGVSPVCTECGAALPRRGSGV